MIGKQYRFHGHNSLRQVYGRGSSVRSRFISLKYFHNPRRDETRFAVVVAKKVTKKAPVRNRIRRRVYEVIRLHTPMIQAGYDVVITVFDERIGEISAAELNKTLMELFTQAKLYK